MTDFYGEQRANIAYHKLRLLIADALTAAQSQGVTDIPGLIAGAFADAQLATTGGELYQLWPVLAPMLQRALHYDFPDRSPIDVTEAERGAQELVDWARQEKAKPAPKGLAPKLRRI